MNAVLKTFLSMSVSGGLLILALLLGKRFLKDKISRQWQYYIWLTVVLRLLLPFGPEVNLLGEIYRAVDQAVTQAAPLPPQQSVLTTSGDIPAPAVDLEQNNENRNSPAENITDVRPLQEIWTLLTNHVWLIWIAAALGLLIRKITVYQDFMRYIKVGLIPVSDLEILDRLSMAAERAGIQKPVELCVNPLISSPLLIGFFHPCIVLPGADISEKNFQYTVFHELIHYKRRDLFYKWLVQITVCLHWFNPLVYLMSREVTKACEFSCDEAVLVKMGSDHAKDYGKTLLDAMTEVGKYKENLGAATLSENKQLLKERLAAIMNFRKKPKTLRFLTGMLTLCIILGAAFIGIYPAAAASYRSSGKPSVYRNPNSAQAGTSEQDSKDYVSQAERYYEAGSLPLFDRLDRRDEFDELESQKDKEWAAAQEAEYQAAGVIMDGKDYYYQGQLVNIFLDIRANKSFYTLNTNPEGTINIKIIRDADDKIADVSYMTEEEAEELLTDMSDEDMEDDNYWQKSAVGRIWYPQLIPVNLETVADGEIVWLGEYTLSDGDRIWYNVLAETGNGLQVGFAKPEDIYLNTAYYCAENLRQQDEPLNCNASFTFRHPVKPGTYKLFLRATDGTLGNVRGSISIGFISDTTYR